MVTAIRILLVLLIYTMPVKAAIALVQATGPSGPVRSGLAITVNSTGTGHLFILSVARRNTGSNVINITDNASGCADTWTDTGAESNSGTFQVDTFWVKAFGCAGVNKIRVTLGGGGLYRATFFEVAGITNPTVERMNANNSKLTMVQNPRGASITTSASSSFIVACLGFGAKSITGKYTGNTFVSSNTYDGYAGAMYLITSGAGTYTPQWSSTNAQVAVSSTVSFASTISTTTWFISPTGSDTNSGTSPGSSWLTPFHFVNCGDTVQAAAGTTYSAANFTSGKWGTVNCPANNNVTWLKCVTFDACKINAGAATGIQINASYWGVQGWEVTTSSSGGNCFTIRPTSGSINHIILANNIANQCAYSGFEVDGGGSYNVDYVAIIGNIAYNTTGEGSSNCSSAIDVFGIGTPLDANPGTHIYLAGNFSYNNVEANPCNGGKPTDGEGLFLDTMGVSGVQAVIDNNMALYNGGRGIQSYSDSNTIIYFRHNTAYGNNIQSGQPNNGICGEITINTNSTIEVFGNLAQTTHNDGCGGATNYAYAVLNGNASNKIYNNYGYDAFAHNIGVYNSPGFVPGSDNIFSNPGFANPEDPGAPHCHSFMSVPACMAKTIANFAPTTATAKPYGYQLVSSTPVYDPLFPQWLCKVNLPTGLVTMGCLTGSPTR